MKKRVVATVLAAIFLAPSSALAYTVQPGDSLWKIATQNKIGVDALMKANNLTSTTIYPGQWLQIPNRTYVVQDHDTMFLIARKLNVNLNDLIRANPQIKNPNNIWRGLVINVPSNTTASDPSTPAIPKPADFTDSIFPLPKGTYQPFTDNYGDGRTWNPDGTTPRAHEGVDIFAPKGTPVYSVADGTVINAGWSEYGGWRLTIRVNDSTAFYYAHLSKYAEGIAVGQTVKKGQLIAYVGNTGYGPVGTEGKFNPHLHFGIYKTNVSPWTTVDPYPYLKWWESRN